MRGMIYKDICLFFRSVEKRMLAVAAVFLALTLGKGGIYGGLLASIMLDMTVGIQNVLVFEKEEKVEWAKYQRTLPLGGGKVVAGKYAAVLATLAVSLTGSVALNAAAFLLHGSFLLPVLALSMLLAVVLPVAWAAVSLPFCYWFSFQVSQYSSALLIFPLFFLIKNFEDGKWTVPARLPVGGSLYGYLAMGLLAVGAAFLASWAVSTAGYCRRRK